MTALSLAPAPLTSGLDLDAVEQGIVLPVVYASIFGSPVRSTALWTQMVGVSATEEEMRAALRRPTLTRLLVEEDGLIWLRRSLDIQASRDFSRRVRATADLLNRNRAVLEFVRDLPHVRFAGLSGACAHEAAEDGDIDVFMVTEEGALWRTLLSATLAAKARGWRRILCLNYLVDESALALPWRDFYGAFEMISLKPLHGDEAFKALLAANPWAEPLFPNFFRSRLHGQNPPHTHPRPSGRHILEAAARMIHRPYLRYRLPRGTGVELSDHVVRLHATDHRTRLRGLFRDALRNIGMEAPSWI